MVRYKEKRNLWVNEEIRCMLDLIRILQIKTGTTATTHYTFVDIHNEMSRRGFGNKSASQIRRKWFQMKSAYHCSKRGNFERIMLIPEEFREEIRNFVESETRNNSPPQVTVTVTPEESKFFAQGKGNNLNNIPTIKVENGLEGTDKKDFVRTEVKTKVFKKTAKGTFGNGSNSQSEEGENFSKDYQKKFSKCTDRMHIVEKSVQNEYIKQQRELMLYEHKLQAERDQRIIDAFMRSTNDIIETTQLILSSIFKTI